MRIFNKTPSNQRGYTMLEVILYISIMGVLGIVLTNYAYRGFIRYRTGRTAQQVIDLKRAVLQYTAVRDDYSTLVLEGPDGMHRSKAIPLDMRNTETAARHALGGDVTLGPSSALPDATNNINNNYMFYLTFDSLSRDSCIEILTQGQFYSDGGDLDGLIVSATGNSATTKTYFYYEHSFFATTLPKDIPENRIEMNRLNIEQALRACASPTRNSVTWIFS